MDVRKIEGLTIRLCAKLQTLLARREERGVVVDNRPGREEVRAQAHPMLVRGMASCGVKPTPESPNDVTQGPKSPRMHLTSICCRLAGALLW